MSLAPFFGELAAQRLFIVFELRPKADGRAGTDKVPFDPYTGRSIDAHNEAARMTLAEAEVWVGQLVPAGVTIAYGVGYVLTEAAGTFFIDLDHCRTNDGWADYVAAILAAFPGAYIETSSSGDGIHVLGRYAGPRPLHRTRCKPLRAELYTAGRFCALTGNFATGAILSDHTAALGRLMGEHFPPREGEDEDEPGGEWRTEPLPGYGIPNDAELIARAMRSSGARAVFGGGVSFADLWGGRADALARAFPPQTAGQDYDGSGADLALANHLCFWSGGNHEQIARLLRASGLARDKHNREDYMRATVTRACAGQTAWYAPTAPVESFTVAVVPRTVGGDASGAPGAAVSAPLSAAPGPSAEPNPYLRIPLPVADFVSVLSEGRYLYRPTRELWPKKSVDVACGAGSADQVDILAPVHQMIWAPGEDEYVRERLLIDGGWIAKKDVGAFNVYRAPEPSEGNPHDVQPWLDHVMRIYPETGAHFVRWLAHRAQHPNVKINHAIVMGGGSGIGKDTILEPVKAAVGPWNMVEVAPETLLGRFNGYVKSVVLRVSEVRSTEVSPHELYERTKTLIAAPPDVLRVDEKNIAEHAVMNITGVIFTTNHMVGGLYLPEEDRRHFVMWSRETRDSMEPHCKALWAWYDAGGLDNVVAYLRAVDIRDFDPKATPPQTDAWRSMVGNSRSGDSDDIMEALDTLGRPAIITADKVLAAIPVGSVSRELFTNPGKRRTIPHRLADCGYVRFDNAATRDRRWNVYGGKHAVYARTDLAPAAINDALRAAGAQV